MSRGSSGNSQRVSRCKRRRRAGNYGSRGSLLHRDWDSGALSFMRIPVQRHRSQVLEIDFPGYRRYIDISKGQRKGSQLGALLANDLRKGGGHLCPWLAETVKFGSIELS